MLTNGLYGNSEPGQGERVLVVGAGLVGSLLAIYLARRGHRVEVWERHADLRRTELATFRSSINLSLCERGFQALDRVGMRSEVCARAVPSYGRLIHGLDGGIAFQPYGNHGEATYSILRNDLNRILVDRAENVYGVVFRFGEKCRDVDLDTPAVQFEETRTGHVHREVASVVLGADGVFSAVRLRLQRTPGFNYAQQYLDHGYSELDVPTVPDRRWAGQRSAVHLWPRGRYMLLGLPNVDGSLVCSLHLPFRGATSFSSLTTPAALEEFLKRSFPDVADLMPDAAEQFFRHRTNHLVSIRCFPWTYGGRVALIGDAAHAVVPFYAQGVNAGFEDCRVLDDCLEDAGDDWATALRLYEERRKPEADAVSDLSLQHFEELRDHVGQPQFLLKKNIERRLAELYQDWFVPIYNRVTFQAAPYTEALRRSREQEALLQQILSLPEVSTAKETELTGLIRQVVDGVTAGRA
ncbi:MAG TPA: NAD(P)/FAD-dependent oxidoreductase [Thermoanaerobaculia bacterium]|nr:NAD(P)/FAD-dependent oxidoreductase [Thermoanaerobaculia bacterium]